MLNKMKLQQTQSWLKEQVSLESIDTLEADRTNTPEVAESESELLLDDTGHTSELTEEGELVDSSLQVATEDYTRVSGEAGGKIIDGYGHDAISGTYKRYVISGFNASNNNAAEATDNKLAAVMLLQNGLVSEVGLNGVTVQDLLKVCENIMEGYQETKFNCPENAVVLECIQKALATLEARMSRRTEQGTMDTHNSN